MVQTEEITALRDVEPYVDEMAELLGIDAWHLMPNWFVSEDKCLTEEPCKIRLAAEINAFLDQLRRKYRSMGIEREPMAVIKNDSGTYGLGVMMLRSGDEIRESLEQKSKQIALCKRWS